MGYSKAVCCFLLLAIMSGAHAAENSMKDDASAGQPKTDLKPLPWSEWSVCSVTCGSGKRSRQQGDGVNIEYLDCDTFGCPIDGGFTSWSAWSVCSTQCGKGTSLRMRTCDNPEPENGGRECLGEESESRSCENTCTGGVYVYGKWSECTKTCGGGQKTRTATCSEGYVCTGAAVVMSTCDNKKCPVCTYVNNYHVFADNEEVSIKRDQQKTVLLKLGKEFKVEFQFKLGVKAISDGKDQSIFHMKSLSSKEYGRKHPLLYIRDNKVIVCVAFKSKDKSDGCFEGGPDVELRKWYDVVVKQEKVGSDYHMIINVHKSGAGTKPRALDINEINADAEEFHDVRVLISDERMEPVENSFVRKLVISGSCPGTQPTPKQ